MYDAYMLLTMSCWAIHDHFVCVNNHERTRPDRIESEINCVGRRPTATPDAPALKLTQESLRHVNHYAKI